MKTYIKRGQFVPVGGTWIEMDCNIPSGESLIRQFLVGQRFFESEFGIKCREFWLPDTFGYAAQLPQIIKQSEIDYFFTQKLSWCQFNKFPHHTFYWEGLDGTKIFTHFAPADTYCAKADVKEVLHSVNNYKDKERSNEALLVYGFGDGGGGPTKVQVENLEIMKNIDGLPVVQMRSPADFFERAEKEGRDIPVWVGELYFEYHRGTYTSQAKNKLHNRKCEYLLREIELYAGLATTVNGSPYPRQEMEKLWKLLLLNQFHDVIPGSSINQVYRDSDEHYAYIYKSGNSLLDEAFKNFTKSDTGNSYSVFNSLSWPRTEVVEVPTTPKNLPTAPKQTSFDGKSLFVVSAPSMGSSPVEPIEISETSTLQEEKDKIILENNFVKAEFDKKGILVSMFDKRAKRQVISGKANQFVLYEDVPMYWDAWDVDVYHLEKRKDVDTESQCKILEKGPLRSSFEVSFNVGKKSRLTQRISLDAISPRIDFQVEVDWQENHQFLKVEFPLKIRAMHATYEIQFGNWQRPTHFNTSWEVAKFEVCGHKWADLSESGYGVSILNDCKYGYACHGNVMRLSLLRSPKNPDPDCDMGIQNFKYAIFPHLGTLQQGETIRQAYNFNVPIQIRSLPSPSMSSAFTLDNPAIVLESVKLAEDSDNEIIVRLYESHGGHATCRLSTPLAVKKAHACNVLERDIASVAWENGGISLEMKPFEILSLKLSL
eukprot:TRINITY_DN4303_c0_g1_i2.p1 TRINITY_DN4303_c0_g1~~TRINITY_DN4303_c0_g1_i2.p1  ORF type:complete len:713 (-),score=261.49 TRINITY_DN4303_c0_g1_i2:116-2254(-)